MRCSPSRLLWLIAIHCAACGSVFSQGTVRALTATSKAEPGLEVAVGWKWWVAPPAAPDWGMPLPEELQPKTPGAPGSQGSSFAVRPETYEVVKGDALVKIAKKFDMTVEQLKQFNELKNDLIQIGQVLRIPTPLELQAMKPPPPPPEPVKEGKGKKKSDKTVVAPKAEPVFDPTEEQRQEVQNVRMQVFLDREMFSPGVIDGSSNPTFLKISELYQRTHTDAANPGMLQAKAEAAVTEPYTHYILRADDFKFIQSPKSKPATPAKKSSAEKKKSTKANSTVPSVTIDDLLAENFLAYTSAWELVAERFHCSEDFLRRINPHLRSSPVVGSDFQVPNVIPFEIEKSLDAPLQPTADPQKPVTAGIVLVSRLEILRDGNLIAVLPLNSARPALVGRDKWTVLNAIPQPRMATKRELREIPKPKPAPPPAATESPTPPPVVAPPRVPAPPPEVAPPPLETEQYLAGGPNNPVGILWINLAKSGSTDPLPYGLHGTSIPSKIGTLQGIGGFRLTNWDIARAVRLMPAGTTIQWRAR